MLLVLWDIKRKKEKNMKKKLLITLVSLFAVAVTVVSVFFILDKPSYIELEPNNEIRTVYYDNESHFVFNDAKVIVHFKNMKKMTMLVEQTNYSTFNNIVGEHECIISAYGLQTRFTYTVAEAPIESISLDIDNIKKEYFESDDNFVIGDSRLTVRDNKGIWKSVNIEESMLSTFNNTVGTHTCTITYKGKTLTFNYEVKAVSAESISIKNNAFKTSYLTTDNGFVINNSTIEVVYNNGNVETQNVTAEMLSSFDNSIGTHTCTITYKGKTATFSYEVNKDEEVVLESIALLTDNIKKSYFTSTTAFEINESALKLIYSDNSESSVAVTLSMLSAFDNTVGTHTCTITYEGKTLTFNYEVKAVVLESITLLVDNIQKKYDTTSTAFEINNSSLELIYNDESTNTVNLSLDMLSAFDNSIGTHTCTITYNGKTTTFSYEVEEVVLESIALLTDNIKKSYFTSATAFEINESTLKLVYSDSSESSVAVDVSMLSSFDNSVGTHTCTITYNGKTTTFEYAVTEPKVQTIDSVSGIDTKYFINYSLKTNYPMVNYTKEDGSTGSSAINQDNIENFSTSSVGNFTMNVVFQEVSYSLPYTVMYNEYIVTSVVNSENSSIDIPKMIYLKRTSVDYENLFTLNTKDNDGLSSYVELSESDCENYNVSYSGSNEINVINENSVYTLKPIQLAKTHKITLREATGGSMSITYQALDGRHSYNGGSSFNVYDGEKLNFGATGNEGYVATALRYDVNSVYSYDGTEKNVSFYAKDDCTCYATFAEAKEVKVTLKLKSINYNEDSQDTDYGDATKYFFKGSFEFKFDHVNNSGIVNGKTKVTGDCGFSNEYKDGCAVADDGTFVASGYSWSFFGYVASGSKFKFNMGISGSVYYAKENEDFPSIGSSSSDLKYPEITISDINSISSSPVLIEITRFNSRFKIVLEYTLTEI